MILGRDWPVMSAMRPLVGKLDASVFEKPFLLNWLARPGKHFYDKAIRRAPRAFS